MANDSQTTHSDPVENTNGEPYLHVTGSRPKSINLIALGPTSSDWQAALCAYDPIIPEADETWTVNKGFRAIKSHLVFIMDDLIGERRKSERYYRDIMKLKTPIITSIIDLDVAKQYVGAYLYEYPLDQIIDFYGLRFCVNRDRNANNPGKIVVPAGVESPSGRFQPGAIVDLEKGEEIEILEPRYSAADVRTAGKQVAGYLKNSVPLMLAYAGFIGVRTINLFGADYDFPGQAIHEADKPNAEYWCGLLIGLLGVEIKVSSRTTLLSTNQGRSIYGYGARQPVL